MKLDIEFYNWNGTGNKGLKGFIHKVLSHKPYQYKDLLQIDPVVEYDCIYEQLLPYKYYKDLLNHNKLKNEIGLVS